MNLKKVEGFIYYKVMKQGELNPYFGSSILTESLILRQK